MAKDLTTLVTDVKARNDRLKIEIQAYDAVDFHLNVFIKEIIVRNLAGRDREVHLFFNHDFHIYGNEIGDTAYYGPDTMAIIHYKSQRYFLINCCDPTKCGVDHFATGIKETQGTEGTWRDAEDGVLSGNPIAQGFVDSTLGVNHKRHKRASVGKDAGRRHCTVHERPLSACRLRRGTHPRQPMVSLHLMAGGI